jgi:hypothetical protein
MFLNKVKDTVGLNTFKKNKMKYSFDPKIFFLKPSKSLPSNSFTY